MLTKPNRKANWTYNYFALVERHFHSKNDWLKKTANMNWLPFSLSLTTSSDAFLYKGRPVTSLGHQMGRRVFWEKPNFFKLCPVVSDYVQHIFPRGAKNFPPPLVTGLYKRNVWVRAHDQPVLFDAIHEKNRLQKRAAHASAKRSPKVQLNFS